MLSRVASNFAAQSVGLILSFADRILVVGILLRVWGAEIYSDWVVLLSTAGLLSLGELGLNIYFGNVWQKAFADNDADRFRRLVSVALACSMILGLAFGVLAVVIVLIVDLPHVLSISTMMPVESIGVLCLLGIAALSRVARGAISQIYRGKQEFARGVLVDQIFIAGLIVATVIAALLEASPVAMAGAYLGCDILLGWCLTIVDIRRRWPDLGFRPSLPTPTELLDMVKQVRWLAILQGTSVVWVQAPVVLLGYLGIAGSSLVSFVVLRTLANLSRQVATLLALSSGVEIAAIFHAGRFDEVARQLRLVGRILAVLTAGFAVAVALYGEHFVALWTGQTTLFDGKIAAALFGAVFIAVPALPLLTLGLFGNRSGPLAFSSAIQIGIGLPACVILGSHYGSLGVAMGLAIGEALSQGVVLPIIAARQARLKYWRYIGECALYSALAMAWCIGIGIGIRVVLDPSGIAALSASALLWVLFGFAPSLLMSLSAAHRESIGRWLRL